METTDPQLLETAAYLLEAVLFTHEKLTWKRHPPRDELERQEQVIHRSFYAMSHDLVRLVERNPGYAIPLKIPRIEKLIGYMTSGASNEDALARYFLALRERGQEPDRA